MDADTAGVYWGTELVVPKVRTDLEITLLDGAVLKGVAFVPEFHRVSDFMNNQAIQFLPFETEGGEFRLINRAIIAQIRPFDERRMKKYAASSPSTRKLR